MDSLEAEIDAEGWALDVHFLGVNKIGQEQGNIYMPAVCDLPWLQDSGDERVWERWDATWRDVILLDESNVPVAVFNVTLYDLSVPANFDSLKSLIAEHAAGQ